MSELLAAPATSTEAPPTRRATLTVVLMTKNEEARLPACLDRVTGWADEIVIIDDESTDQTVEVARRYGAKVFIMASADNHLRQWNRGIEQASSDWVLHLDADEWVTPQLQQAIDGVLRDDRGHSAFELMRKNIFLGHPMRYGGWYHRHLILFRRERARCVGSGVHPAAHLRVSGTIGFLNADVEHYPFSSLSQYIARQNHYTSVEARVLLEERGRLPRRDVLFQLTIKPAKLFWKSFVKNGGWREGWYGFVFALLQAFTHFIHWAKYWERLERSSAGLGS